MLRGLKGLSVVMSRYVRENKQFLGITKVVLVKKLGTDVSIQKRRQKKLDILKNRYQIIDLKTGNNCCKLVLHCISHSINSQIN